MRLPRRLSQLGHRVGRPLVAGLALAGYLLAVAGFPVPLRPAKDLSRPFPCQNHRCGCLSADDCWHHCCCFSSQERLAWARKHEVVPPPVVRAEAPLSWNTPRLRDRQAAARPPSTAEGQCPECRRLPTTAACCRHDQGQQPSCCTTRRPASQEGTAVPAPKTTWVIALTARCCGGFETDWLHTGAALLPALLDWRHDWAPVCWLELIGLLPLALPSPPSAPPPRG
jgi:hypothetical protein